MMSRETLSAWMDGELQGDEGRFVSKRLTHDDALHAQVSRWTDIGDALREMESSSRADAMDVPVGFLDRVRVAIDQERAQVYAPSASEVAVVRDRIDAVVRSRAQRLKAFAQKPSAIAASVTLLAAAVLLLRVGSPLDAELLTSLTMQNAATPSSAEIRRAARPPAPRAVNTRIAVKTPARVTRTPVATTRAPRTVEQVRQINTVASAPTTVQSLPPRVSSTFTHVKPNVAASSADPFGLGNTSNNRILSGSSSRTWPRSRVSGSNRPMNASFSTSQGGVSAGSNDPFSPNASANSAWPAQMSLGVPRGE